MQKLAEHALNPDCIRVMSWNVMKQSRPWLAADLAGLSRELDLALLQEVHVEGACLDHFNESWHRSFAPGFTLPGKTTGVMTLASAGHRSEDRFSHLEPLIRIPKAATVTTYDLANVAQPLMVVNLHAVNFSLGMSAYRQQLHDVLQVIDRHQGPVILAGDFNAWRDERTRLVAEIATLRGLEEVPFANDERTRVFGKYLDYMFVRGLRVHEARTRKSRASDHNPLIATLGL